MNSVAHIQDRRSAPLLVLVLLAIMIFAMSAMPARITADTLAQTEDDVPEGALLVIYDEVTGPYRVKVTQSPARAIVGTLRVIVEPEYADTGEPVENALVRIFGTPPREGERQFSPGLNTPTDRTVYFGQLELDHGGDWTLDVEIDGDRGTALAITQTTIHERARSGSNTAVGTVLFILISGAFVGSGTWLWYSSRRAQRKRDEIRRKGGRPRRSVG